MLKRIVGSFAVATGLMLVLTGCVDFKVGVDIRNDGTSTNTMTMTIERDAIVKLGENPDEYAEEMLKDLDVGKDTEVIPIDTENVVGYTLIKDVVWEGDSAKKSENSDTIPSVVERVDRNLVFTLPLKDLANDAGSEDLGMSGVESYRMMLNSFDVNVSFPGDVVSASHNGVVEGNTVVWGMEDILVAMENGESLTATGASTNFSIVPILLIGGVLILLIAAGIIFFVLRNKNKTGTPVVGNFGGPGFDNQPQHQFGAQPIMGENDNHNPGFGR